MNSILVELWSKTEPWKKKDKESLFPESKVALENLQIKENALSQLDVPFKVKVGQTDKITLKIPCNSRSLI